MADQPVNWLLKFRFVAPMVIILAGSFAYLNSFHGTFVFDDFASIIQNPNIRALWPLTRALDPAPKIEPGTTLQGRPLLSLSFALNHAWSGEKAWSYHLVNIAIHLADALLLFGICRITVSQFRGNHKKAAESCTAIAAIISLLWVVHPLTTNAVTYLVQRAESLGSLFVLLSLFCTAKIQLDHVSSKRTWAVISVISAFCGVLTKESAGVIPIAVLLYQRSYFYASFRTLWKEEKRYLLALAGSWIVLAGLIWAGNARAGTIGFSRGVSSWDYLLVQGWAILRYLRLTLFPIGLSFDYGESLVAFPERNLLWLFITAVLVITFAWIWYRRPATGFPLILFFLLLAPTSSFIPVQTHFVAEHRVYLPLACILTSVVICLTNVNQIARWPKSIMPGIAILTACWWGFLTHRQNALFENPELLWLNAWHQRPLNWRASNNYGVTLLKNGELEKAIKHYEDAARAFDNVAPHSAESWKARRNLAFALMPAGRVQEALPQLQRLAEENPDPVVIGNIGLAQAMENEPGAMGNLKKAIELNPSYAEGYNNIGWVLAREGDFKNAISEFTKALDLQPISAEALSNLREACQKTGDTEIAFRYAEKAHRLAPSSVPILIELTNCQLLAGKTAEAISLLQEGLSREPSNLKLRKALGVSLLNTGMTKEGLNQLEMVAEKSDPLDLAVLNNVAWLLATSPNQTPTGLRKAEGFARAAVSAQPEQPLFRGTLAAVLAAQERYPEAIEQFQQGIRLADKLGNRQLVDDLEKRLTSYRKGKP